MVQRIWAVLRKEFIHTWRDRRTLMLLLTTPIIQLFLFGYAVDMNVQHIPTAVADQSLDAASRAYVDAMVNSTYFDVARYVAGEADVIAAIDAGEAQAGIVIPPDFAGQVERGQAQVLFLVDGSDLFTVQSGYAMATTIAQAHATEVMMRKIARSGLDFTASLPLDARMRVLYNPDMEQLRFAVPNIVAMLLQTQSIMMVAAAIVREREAGTIEQILVTPIRPLELLLGKMMPYVAIALLNMATVVAVGRWVFGVPFEGSFRLFTIISLLYVFSGLGLGLLVSTVTNNVDQAQQISGMVLFLGVLLGGFMFPRSTMPPFLYGLGFLFPLSYFLPVSRGLIVKGVGLAPLMPQILGMFVYGVLVMLIAVRAFRQGLE